MHNPPGNQSFSRSTTVCSNNCGSFPFRQLTFALRSPCKCILSAIYPHFLMKHRALHQNSSSCSIQNHNLDCEFQIFWGSTANSWTDRFEVDHFLANLPNIQETKITTVRLTVGCPKKTSTSSRHFATSCTILVSISASTTSLVTSERSTSSSALMVKLRVLSTWKKTRRNCENLNIPCLRVTPATG